ncbi:hypothetical protein BGW80DRAFT_1247045 [Lactifluus volemus]|nr:hypothetical protein BGW80DRAFT_1247045 [Lactifluus volemus]
MPNSPFSTSSTPFRCRWFLSVDNLRAKALSAQKAKDRKFFWVKYVPQFHAHLVKCAVTLVPRPIDKVKKVMFRYILELLNRKARKPSSTSQKASRELCRPKRRRGDSHRKGTAHRGEIAKKWLKKLLTADHNGNARHVDVSSHPAKLQSDTDTLFPWRRAERVGMQRARVKPPPMQGRTSQAPPNPTAPSNMVTPLATTALQTAKMLKTKASKKKKKQNACKRPNTPSSAFKVASSGLTPSHTTVREFASDQRYKGTSN